MRLRRCIPWVLLVMTGCQFDDTGLSGGAVDAGGSDAEDVVPDAADPGDVDATPDPADAGPVDARPDARQDDIDDDVAHVPDEAEVAGSADLVLSGDVRIDTSALTISDQRPPAGVVFDSSPQDGGGLDLAILHVDALQVSAGARVRVVGRRPLVVIAGGAVSITGIIDAGGKRSEPGAAGRLPGEGLGAGGIGAQSAELSDSGGGGAGYGELAGAGGSAGCNPGGGGGCTALGGKAGPIYGAPEIAT